MIEPKTIYLSRIWSAAAMAARVTMEEIVDEGAVKQDKELLAEIFAAYMEISQKEGALIEEIMLQSQEPLDNSNGQEE